MRKATGTFYPISCNFSLADFQTTKRGQNDLLCLLYLLVFGRSPFLITYIYIYIQSMFLFIIYITYYLSVFTYITENCRRYQREKRKSGMSTY